MLKAALELELTEYFLFSPLKASEEAESKTPLVARVISRRLLSCESDGVSPVLTLLGMSSDSVAGYCHVLPQDQPYVCAIKKQRLYADLILQAIRKLSFSQFEKFGSRILAELGAKQSWITPHGGDQGIDFFGHLSAGQLHNIPQPFLKMTHDVIISFVGQAKHYPNRSVGPDIVRELIGAVSLARTKTFSRTDVDIFANLGLKPFSPLVTLLLTTGSISSGAAALAESAGITARSGEQLAILLADRGIGIIQTANGLEFDQASFDHWLNNTLDT